MIVKATRTATLAAGLLLLLMSSPGSAGEFYTDIDAFNAAVADHFLIGTENFDSYPSGPVPSPSPFMAGQIEIGGQFTGIYGGNQQAVSVPNEWTGTATTISGPDGGPLGFSAFGFWSRRISDGTWTFETSTGVDTFFQAKTGFPIWQANFLGWVGTGDETLVSVSHSNIVVTLDDLAAFSLAPTIDAAIENLILTTASINLARGIANSLDRKLDNALDAYCAEKDSISQKLQAYVNEVEAQRDKAITDADADLLTGMAIDLIILIETTSE
jgi:hypothetical protein